MAGRLVLLSGMVAGILGACASPGAPALGPGPAGPPGTSAGAPAVPPRVIIATGADVTDLSTKLDPRTGSFRYDPRFLVNSPLVVLDQQGAPHPYLASDRPSRDRGTWTVNADGSMATTWKIRPNAVWHNDQPLTSRDFVFALKVFQDPEIEVYQREVETLIDRIEALDDHTFTLYWRQIYLKADRLLTGQLEPLPANVASDLYEAGDKAAFQVASFWTSTDYVGNGPFRIVEWERGSHTTYRAFDRFFLGKPKIQEVVLRVVTDANAAVASLLAGSVDFSSAQVLTADAGQVVKQEWDQTGAGHVMVTPAVLHVSRIQLEPTRAGQPALQDVRVRRALVHAIDRVTLAETVSGGASPAADTLVTPHDPLYPRVQQEIAKYPYDPGRALALVQEAGWTRRGDTLINARGDPFALDIKTSIITLNVPTVAIMASHLRALGMQISETHVRQGSEDREQSVSFPGLNVRTVPSMEVPEGLRVYASEQCPTAERRFVGDNEGCWSNAEFDRLYRVAMTTLDERERIETFIRALRVLTEDVGIIGLSYNIEYVAVRKGLVGPAPRPVSQRGYTWNIHEWHWS